MDYPRRSIRDGTELRNAPDAERLVTRVMVGLDENPNPPENRLAAKGRRRSLTTAEQPPREGERKSLAGKYAHLVRR